MASLEKQRKLLLQQGPEQVAAEQGSLGLEPCVLLSEIRKLRAEAFGKTHSKHDFDAVYSPVKICVVRFTSLRMDWCCVSFDPLEVGAFLGSVSASASTCAFPQVFPDLFL